MSEAFQGDPFLGSTFEDRFRMESCIGRGAMGAIYKATDLTLDRPVAVKVLQRKHAREHDMLMRFEREMETTTRIEHPNSIRVYEYGVTDDDEMYLVMEYLHGETVAKVIAREGPLDVDRVVRIASQVASALAAAHAKGIVHRDLKPDNIMLLDSHGQKDFVKVFDFGLARYVEDHQDQARLTMGDHRVGTPISMAPEYIVKGKVGRRSDLYGLGVVMFTMLSGKPPFEGSPYKVLHQHVKSSPPPLNDYREGIPRWLQNVVLQLLEKNPDDRQRTALVLIEQLESRTTDYTRAAEHAFDDVETLSGQLSKDELRDALHDMKEPPPPKDISDASTAVPGASRVKGPQTVNPEEDTVPLLHVPPPQEQTDEASRDDRWRWVALAVGLAIALLLVLNLIVVVLL